MAGDAAVRSPVTKGAAYVGVLIEPLRVTIFIDHAQFVCECVDERHRDRIASDAYDALDCWPLEKVLQP